MKNGRIMKKRYFKYAWHTAQRNTRTWFSFHVLPYRYSRTSTSLLLFPGACLHLTATGSVYG